MSKNDNYPIFSLTNIVSKTKQNKQNTAVESKPLGYREHKKQVQQRQQKAIHDTKVWLGLIPETQPQFKGDKKWGRKNTQWGKKPWQQAKRINVKWQSKGWVQKKFHVKKKFDRFAKQKQWLKEWKGTTRFSAQKYTDYIGAVSTRRKGCWYMHGAASRVFNNSQHGVFLKTLVKKGAPLQEKEGVPILAKAAFNRYLTKQLMPTVGVKKQPLTLYDKVFYYYTLQTPLTMYAHKAFILLEMQLNATLVRAKLVPYLFLVRDLCFYRLVQINTQVAKNPYQVISLYDSVSIPVYLHNYMYYRQYRIQYYPQNIGSFFKQYWAHFTNYTNNKVWLLSNFVTSDATAETILFDYPNITLYMGPFKRFTKLYYKNHPYAPMNAHRHLNHTHTILKLKLFEYAAFYR